MSELGQVQSVQCGQVRHMGIIRFIRLQSAWSQSEDSEAEQKSIAAIRCSTLFDDVMTMSRWLKASAKEEGSTGSKAVTWKRTVFAGCNRTTDALFQQPKCAVIGPMLRMPCIQCRASSTPAVHWASWMVRRRRIIPGTTRGDQCESWTMTDELMHHCQLGLYVCGSWCFFNPPYWTNTL